MTWDEFKRWIGPLCALALGAGSIVGAIQYRNDSPANQPMTAFNPSGSAEPSIVFVEATSTVTATPAPVTETVRPDPRTIRAVETVTQTVTRTAEPEPEVQKVTVTQTVTRPASPVENVRNDRGQRENRTADQG